MLSKKQSSIALILYIFITLAFRFWLESNYVIGIIPSVLIGLLFLAIPVYLWKKNIVNPYREDVKK